MKIKHIEETNEGFVVIMDEGVKPGRYQDLIAATYAAEPLSKEGRETVLKTMREYLDKGQNEFIMSFQDTYIKEDWDWLMKELEKQ